MTTITPQALIWRYVNSGISRRARTVFRPDELRQLAHELRNRTSISIRNVFPQGEWRHLANEMGYHIAISHPYIVAAATAGEIASYGQYLSARERRRIANFKDDILYLWSHSMPGILLYGATDPQTLRDLFEPITRKREEAQLAFNKSKDALLYDLATSRPMIAVQLAATMTQMAYRQTVKQVSDWGKGTWPARMISEIEIIAQTIDLHSPKQPHLSQRPQEIDGDETAPKAEEVIVRGKTLEEDAFGFLKNTHLAIEATADNSVEVRFKDVKIVTRTEIAQLASPEPISHLEVYFIDGFGQRKTRFHPINAGEKHEEVALSLARQPDLGVYGCGIVEGDPKKPTARNFLLYFGEAISSSAAMQEVASSDLQMLVKPGIKMMVRTTINGAFNVYSALLPGIAVSDLEGNVTFPLGAPSFGKPEPSRPDEPQQAASTASGATSERSP